MNQSLMIGKHDLAIHYTPARIIHSNKYNQNSGFYLSHFFFSNLLQDLVFELDQTGKKHQITLKNITLPAYQGQEVLLIVVNDLVLGYIDNESNKYYYLTDDLSGALGLGIGWKWFIIGGLAAGAGLFFLLPEDIRHLFFYFLLIVPVLYKMYREVFSRYVEKKLDSIIVMAN